MERYQIGDKFLIHSYKHDGNVHRSWDEAVLLDVKEDYMVFGNNKTEVIDSNGSSRKTKEPAIMFFYKDKWYNIVAQLKKKGLFYYCNIASPFIIEERVIKYIDYDLDLRIFPDGSYKVLDRNEYKYHKKKMGYSDDLDFILNKELERLIDAFLKEDVPFREEVVKHYYEIYQKVI